MADIYIYDSYDKKSISEGVSVWKTDNFVRSAKDIILSCQLQIKNSVMSKHAQIKIISNDFLVIMVIRGDSSII